MAYPFIKFPSFGEFRDRVVNDFGCTYRKVDNVKLVDQSGYEHELFVFEREVNGKTLHVSPQSFSDETVLTPSVLRSLCNRLQIPLDAFGLKLG